MNSISEPSKIEGRIAIPFFMERVSPVLDNCTQIMLVELGQDREVCQTPIGVVAIDLAERVSFFKMLGVKTIVCGAVSDTFHCMLKDAGIVLVCGIAGSVEEIIQACGNGSFRPECFHMPGYSGNN
jgi:hypothetical protein